MVRFITTLIIVFAAFFTAATVHAQSAPGNNFYLKGSAGDPLSDLPLDTMDAPEIQVLRPTPEAIERAIQAPDGKLTQVSQKAKNQVKIPTSVRERDGKDDIADDLVSQYGDPTAESTLKAQENAPTPFKGMMAALDKGRDDLAMMYAMQYVRHFKKVQAATGKVMQMVPVAMQMQAAGDALKNQVEASNETAQPQPEQPAPQAPQNLSQQNQELDRLARTVLDRVRADRDRQSSDAEAFGFGGPISGYAGGSAVNPGLAGGQ